MKPNIKSTIAGAAFLAISSFTACIKDKNPVLPPTNTGYKNTGAFYAANGVPMQNYTVSGTIGGSFTTPQGTKVTIPANFFITQNGVAVTGNVTILFKDIYAKSDMLMSDMTTQQQYFGGPLKSGGEFFIKAMVNGSAVNMNGNAPITIAQPFNGFAPDKQMNAFIRQDSAISVNGGGWNPAPFPDSLAVTASGYVFSLYGFGYPADSGTWCNSDNSSYFSAYTQTNFTIQTNDDSLNYGYPDNVDVFLDFTGLNSLVHVYMGNQQSGITTFPYAYAPLGLKCTVIAVETRASGQLRCAFVPTTITTNGTVSFNCTPTTLAAFKTQMSSYNN